MKIEPDGVIHLLWLHLAIYDWIGGIISHRLALFSDGNEMSRCTQFCENVTWHVHMKNKLAMEFQNVMRVVKFGVSLSYIDQKWNNDRDSIK